MPKLSVYYQRRKQIERLSKKALEINSDVKDMIRNLKNDNYNVENDDILYLTKQRIEEIASKEKPTQKDLERMKEYASVTMYDVGLKIEMKVPDKTYNGIQVQENKFISLGELRKALGREVRFATNFSQNQSTDINGALSERDIALVSQYAQSLIHEGNVQVPEQTLKDLSTDAATSKAWARKNVQIGKYSSLLNDLSYTFGAYRLGTEFVIKLQGIMANPGNFVLIESWYQSPDGKNVKQLINDSVKQFWYKGFLSFSVAIIEAINSMPNLDKASNQILSDMQEQAEIIADEEMY